jgi:hypothetical protein
LAEDDDGSSGEHLRSSASSATDAVDHGLEMLEIVHPHSHERVGITRERERLDDLGEVCDSCVDVSDLRSGREASSMKASMFSPNRP